MLELTDFDENELYEELDDLCARQDKIEENPAQLSGPVRNDASCRVETRARLVHGRNHMHA